MTAKKGARLIVRRSHFEHPNAKLPAFVEGHPYNCALQVLLPSCASGDHKPSAEHLLLRSRTAERITGRHYSLLRCQLATLADEDFVERHIRAEAACFGALSVNTPLDRTDAAAFLPDGRLLLTVAEDTYTRLGLLGAHDQDRPGPWSCPCQLRGTDHA